MAARIDPLDVTYALRDLKAVDAVRCDGMVANRADVTIRRNCRLTDVRHCGHNALMSSDELITTAKAGALIGRSARTVIRLAEAGVLPVAQKLPGINGAYLFRRLDVESLLPDEPTQPDPQEVAS